MITSDRGLVGGYNASILKTMMEMKAEYHPTGDDFEVICIGSVGADFFRARGFSRFMNCVVCLINLALRKFVRSFLKTVQMYQEGLFDELYVCYNHHVNSLTSQMRVEQMLPDY